jgi:hypothetical protein
MMARLSMRRPHDGEFAPYYARYVSQVTETDVVAVLRSQPGELRNLASGIGADRELFRYAPDKWSIRQVLGHIVDTDRMFGHRAFCIARGERQPLPGFDQDEYMAAAHFERQPAVSLVGEFAAVREANLMAVESFDDADWDRIGAASGHAVSVRALAFMMAGHVRHHCQLLRDRYGIA